MAAAEMLAVRQINIPMPSPTQGSQLCFVVEHPRPVPDLKLSAPLPPEPRFERLLSALARRKRNTRVPSPFDAGPLAASHVSHHALVHRQTRRLDQRDGRPLVALPPLPRLELVILQHGCTARVCSVEHRLPLAPRPAFEGVCENLPQLTPSLPVEPVLFPTFTGQPQPLHQRPKELRLQRSNRDVLPVLGLVRVVVGTPAVQHVPPPPVAPQRVLEREPRERREVR
ncbi:hypothetical protein CGRA01v4_03556 [Colletotrichum graminicola]|nr:hypothetical protein CGRA01v4_03556 [Colletotrichum graminicola]